MKKINRRKKISESNSEILSFRQFLNEWDGRKRNVPEIVKETEQKNVEAVKELISQKVEIDEVDYNGKTALLSAIENDKKSEQLVKMLLDAGADVNKKDKIGYTSLDVAYLTSGYIFDKPNSESIDTTSIDNIIEMLKNAGAKASR